jgi:hypothetical protein
MKIFFSILSFIALGVMTAQAQSVSGPVMTFDQTSIDYGVIEKGADPVRKFRFINTGNEPLIIKTAKGSCGCLVPTFPQEPIMPGESKEIDVRYDTNRPGPFQKTVTITTNETPDTHMLTVKGEVKVPPTQESVPSGSGGLKQ